ncbi:hypothetical protein BC940DRAFT_294936 [Gongronella butleri]|nr:hypothetical protein BC940DRAFT_294936 [Gongronella butleri]
MKVSLLSVSVVATLLQAVWAMPVQSDVGDLMLGTGGEMTRHQASNAEFRSLMVHGTHDLTRRDVLMSIKDLLNDIFSDDLLGGMVGAIEKLDPNELVHKVLDLVKQTVSDVDEDLVQSILTLVQDMVDKIDIPKFLNDLLPHKGNTKKPAPEATKPTSGDSVSEIPPLPMDAPIESSELDPNFNNDKRDNVPMVPKDTVDKLTTQLHTLYQHGQEQSATKQGMDKMALVQSVTQLVASSAMQAARMQ